MLLDGEKSKQYLNDLAARVKTIKDDILDEELDVETQLIRVSTSAVSWKSFNLEDLSECIGLMEEGMIWERCQTNDLRVGDIIQTRNSHAEIQIPTARVLDTSRRNKLYTTRVEPEVQLPSGNKIILQDTKRVDAWSNNLKTYRETKMFEVWRNKKKHLSFEECIRLQDTAVCWRELPDLWELKAGDIIRGFEKGMSIGRLTARPVERYRFLYLAVELPDGTEHNYEAADKSKIERVLDVPVGVSSAMWKSVHDVDDVCKGVLETSDPVLMVAGPGTGKTWFLQQLCCRLVRTLQSKGDTSLLPVLVPVQKLARILRQHPEIRGMELMLEFLEMDYSQYVNLLKAKLQTKELIFLIDGVDEAAGMRQTIESFIHDFLKPTGNRMVVTSRPEGVRLPLYCQEFSIVQLLPLTPEQQLSVIQHFLKEDEFLSSLFKLSNVRSGHDNVFNTSFDKNQRLYVESLEPSNHFKFEDGSWDPSKRQKALNGSDLCVVSSFESLYLQSLQGAIEAHDILRRLEEKLHTHCQANEALKAAHAEMIVDTVISEADLKFDDVYSELRKVCVRLCLLHVNTEQSDRTLGELWNHIASRTDALFVSAEHFLPIYEKWLLTLQQLFGEGEVKINKGSMKDPVRIYEKGENDYSGRFDDGSLPVACVVDVLRARLVCRNANVMEKMIQILQKDVNVVAMEQDKSSIVRLKNMFHQSQLTPTHFRFKIVTLQLVDGNASFLVEAQLQLDAIMTYEESADGHAAYEYFRSSLKERYDAVLGNALQAPRIEESLSRFEEMAKVPVLLSLIVVILLRGDVDDPLAALQWSTFELYERSMACVVRRSVQDNDAEAQIVTDMLTKVSVANMRAQRRLFDLNEVEEALTGDNGEKDLFQKWLELQEKKGGVPLVKTLSEPTTFAKGGLYQFKHLSFSEAFYFGFLTRPGKAISTDEARTVVSDPFYKNVFQFGRNKLLAASRPKHHMPLAGALMARLQKD